jgi:hypothetical protein
MVGLPAATPVKYPVVAVMLAKVASLDDHVPPVVTSARVVVIPLHTPNVPVIAFGPAFTVMGQEADAEPQPVVTV